MVVQERVETHLFQEDDKFAHRGMGRSLLEDAEVWVSRGGERGRDCRNK